MSDPAKFLLRKKAVAAPVMVCKEIAVLFTPY